MGPNGEYFDSANIYENRTKKTIGKISTNGPGQQRKAQGSHAEWEMDQYEQDIGMPTEVYHASIKGGSSNRSETSVYVHDDGASSEEQIVNGRKVGQKGIIRTTEYSVY